MTVGTARRRPDWLPGARRFAVRAMLALTVAMPGLAGAQRGIAARDDSSAWPVRVREHVDLWLHGFAMLQGDSTLVPYFQRGYLQHLTEVRTHLGLTTQLDANADRLRARLIANPSLVSAQFLPLYVSSWEELRQYADLFERLQGDPRGARDRHASEMVATFAAYFPTRADRDWVRLFVASLEDERAKFYDNYWREQQRELGPAYDLATNAWRDTYGPRFARFLHNSQQREGEVLACLPLGGEGRTLSAPNRPMTVAVAYPNDTTRPALLTYVFTHEIIGSVANSVVTDNTSPADKRNGLADQYSSLAAVRGGAMLLKRIAPELVDGYMRYYLETARRPMPAGSDIARLFASTFPLPDALRDALDRQIDIILGGI